MDEQTILDLGGKKEEAKIDTSAIDHQRWGAPYNPNDSRPLKLSRGKIDLFTECPRCAYLDLRLGIKRPKTPTFTLNNAVDALLKREFDVHRAQNKAHPLMERYGVDAIPFAHKNLDDWRENFVGVQYFHKPTNLLITGAVDDIWQSSGKELIVVDYKATSKQVGPNKVDDLYDSYKRQMEVYQWLLRQNGFKVSDVGYFVYCNGRADKKAFDGKLEFDIALIKYVGQDSWVEEKITELKKAVAGDEIPAAGKAFNGDPCDYCGYAEQRTKITLKKLNK